MKLKKDGLLAKYIQKTVEKEKRKSQSRPAIPFIGEKKQMWYFLMNQIDGAPPEDGGETSEKTDRG